MKKTFIFVSCLLVQLSCFASTGMQQKLNALSLMTSQDVAAQGQSNLNLTNNTGKPITVFGLYLYGVGFIEPGRDCQNGIIPPGTNYTFQPFMTGLSSPVTFNEGQSIAVGQNYLYNMLYTFLYFYTQIGGSPNCVLPGCSWSTDLTPVNWCVQLGAVSPDASYTDTPFNSNTVPFSWAINFPGFNYNYDLIPNTGDYNWIGPFTCSDQTLTCTTPLSQNQFFQGP